MAGWVSQAIEKLKAGRRGREKEPEPAPPMTTQSSPGQIASLQDNYGADMKPPDPTNDD